MTNGIDMRTTEGKRQQHICQILIDRGTTHNGWSLSYTYEVNNELFKENGLHDVHIGEMVMCINIIRMAFGLQQVYYEMRNGVWEWDYSYPTE